MDHRLSRPELSRRGLFAWATASLVVATLGGCDNAPGATPTATPTIRPPDNTPLAVWELAGGFAVPGMLALRAPRLVVFGDGEAIADAVYRARLDPEQVQSLAAGLTDDLRSTEAQKKPTVSPTIVDAPVTKVSVWSATGTLSFSAAGLDELRSDHVYAGVLYDARDRLAAVHKTASATAQPYLATRVRVVAVNADGDPADATQWPADVTLPAPDGDGVRTVDLDGDAARGAVRMLTRDLDQRGAWPAYRAPDGTLIRACWRYLLPNE